MRNLVLALGASAVVAVCVAGACSDTEVVNNGGSTTTTSGGHGGSGNTGNTGGGANGGAGGGCPGCGPCEQACYKIEAECAFPISCAQIPGGLLDCEGGQPEADCNGDCIVAADCETIMTLAGANPDPTLFGCLQDCSGGAGGGNPCSNCVGDSCQAEIAACAQVEACQPYINCIMACANQACLEDCHTNNPSAETDDLATCICGSCGSDCPCGAGGGGGAAGAGGAAGGTGGAGGT